MSWPDYSSCGSSLILHLSVLLQSWCPKCGIIGSGSTLEHAMTLRSAASTGTSQWNCTRKGYFNISLVQMCFPNLKGFFRTQGQKYGGLYVALKNGHSFCTHSLSAVRCYQQTTICTMEGTGFGVRNEGRRLPNNQSKFALFKSVHSGKCLLFYTMQQHEGT